jgi:hypothetical protein
VRLARDQPQARGEDGRRPAAPFEVRAHRLEQAPEHERQRLEPFDGPLEIEVRLEGFLRHERHERPALFAAGQPLHADGGLAEALGELRRWQRRQVAEGLDAPPRERLHHRLVPGTRLHGACLAGRAPPRLRARDFLHRRRAIEPRGRCRR